VANTVLHARVTKAINAGKNTLGGAYWNAECKIAGLNVKLQECL